MNAPLSPSMKQKCLSEGVGTAFLVAAVIGSGIMASRLAGDNGALALLCNALATGAALTVLISIFGPLSGAHFNPAVSLIMRARGELETKELAGYVAAQVAGGLAGAVAAHAMFAMPLFQISQTVRSGGGLLLAEIVATTGLLLTILLTVRFSAGDIARNVGLYITAAYWFTASTSFANPAVTIARAMSDTYAGIHPASVLPFIAAQLVGAALAMALAQAFEREGESPSSKPVRRQPSGDY